MEELLIEKLDNQGRGICYYKGKITFVANALPGEKVTINLIKENKKYNEAIIEKIITKSPKRVESLCPYFGKCGGCEFQNLNYDDTIEYKKEKLSSIMLKYVNLNPEIRVTTLIKNLEYRNKITLKVINGKYGYYESSSHNLIEINQCLLAEKAINKFLKDIKYLNVKNGEVTIRSNYNNELLIWIKTKEKVKPYVEYLMKNHKIVGIVINEETYYGDNSFIEIINHQLFSVSYNSFFQVNRNVCSKLFKLINEYVSSGDIVLDLYCGVGTLGINASSKASKVYSIEIVKNAIINATVNAKINKRNNILFMLGDVKKELPKIKDKINTIIVDPPRAGLDKSVVKTILNIKADKIIYTSCDPMTLARDIKLLSGKYSLEFVNLLDMFPFTQHIESVCLLKLIK